MWLTILAVIGFLVLWRSLEEGVTPRSNIYLVIFLGLHAYGWWVRRTSHRG